MAGNTLLTISQITYDAAMVLKNTLQMGSRVNRSYEDQFARTGAKIGATVNIRKPPRFVGRTGNVARFEGMVEQYVALTLSQFGVDMNFTTADLTLSIDNFRRRFLLPAIATIANKIDADGLALYNQVPWMVGTPGTTPNALLTYTTAGAILSEEAFPRKDMLRSLMLNPNCMATIADANRALFNPQGQISDQYLTGLMSMASGWNWYEDANVTAHTVGALGGTPLVNGASQTGSSLITDGWTASTAVLKKGDIFTIGSGATSIYAVNPQSRQSTGRLRQFVVTADSTSDGSGNLTIPIYPAITPPVSSTLGAQFQTVTASPADNATINVVGAANTISPQNIGFHRDAITLAMCDMEMPVGLPREAMERVSDPESNISIRMVQFYDGVSDLAGARLDVLYGWSLIYPEGCIRIAA